MTKAKCYYEAHVTIEPVFDDERERAAVIAQKHGFKLAKLLMQKRATDAPERSKHDTFMTSHSVYLEDISSRTRSIVNDLMTSGFKVWRYKIEDILVDSKLSDSFSLFDNQPKTV